MSRIVVAASPLSGHVLPMVLIAAHLRDLGHEVVVLTDEGHHRIATAHDLTFEPLDPTACASAPTPSSVLRRPLPRLLKRYLLGRAEVRSTFIAPLVPQYRSLRRVVESSAADAILVDLAFTGALPVLSAPTRPAVLVCGVGPVTLTSRDTAPFGMAWPPRAGKDYTRMQRVVNEVLLRAIGKELDSALRAVDAPECPVPLMDWPRLADRLLQLTVPDFEYPRTDLPSNVEFVGPVLPQASGEFTEPDWWDDVRTAQTVVLVTQGTLDNGDLDQLIGPTLDAFADRADVVVVATTGRRQGPQLSRPIPSNAHVAEWLPYCALLPHVDVMITNGGYGGVQHALSYGIPVLVAGESSDKAEVAARVAHTGVGVNLGTAHPDPAEIVAAVRDITEDCRGAARRLGREMARSKPLDRIAQIVADELSRPRSTAPS